MKDDVRAILDRYEFLVANFGGGGGGGGPRQMFPATCASCGKQTEVPFKPSGNRPVYCRECFQAQRH